MASYNVVVDSSTFIVLAISANPAAIAFLHENLADTFHVPGINHPNYDKTSWFGQQKFFLASVHPDKLTDWTWNHDARKLSKTREGVATPIIREKSALAMSKAKAFEVITWNLNAAGNKLRTGVHFQQNVYLLKRLEAEKFKASGYDEKLATEVPFVTQYADFADVSLKQAADDILFRAKLDEGVLVRSEGVRLRYLKQLRDATTPAEALKVLENFRTDQYRNALV